MIVYIVTVHSKFVGDHLALVTVDRDSAEELGESLFPQWALVTVTAWVTEEGARVAGYEIRYE